MSMTPEQWTAVLGGVAVVLTAFGGVLAKIHTSVQEIKHATNGAAASAAEAKRALEAKVEALEHRLVEALAAKLEAALIARQAATDVRSARDGRSSADEEWAP